LASKYARDHFKRIQINLFVGNSPSIDIEECNLEEYQEFFPKNIQINTKDFQPISRIINIKELFNPSLLSFNDIRV
jgi:hypothetical protein